MDKLLTARRHTVFSGAGVANVMENRTCSTAVRISWPILLNDPPALLFRKRMGAQYRSYRIDICEEKIADSFTLREDKWRMCPPYSFLELFQSYAEKHRPLVKEILRRISEYDQDVFFTNGSDMRESLDAYMNMEEANNRSVYFDGAPDRCDICKIPFADEEFLIDGEVGKNGPWAFMCKDCFLKYGGRIACGYGQLYRKDAHGWLLVGGFCPESEPE